MLPLKIVVGVQHTTRASGSSSLEEASYASEDRSGSRHAGLRGASAGLVTRGALGRSFVGRGWANRVGLSRGPIFWLS